MSTPNPKGYPTESPMRRLQDAISEVKPHWSYDEEEARATKRMALRKAKAQSMLAMLASP